MGRPDTNFRCAGLRRALPVRAALGVRVPLYRRLGVGYRFLHYSDAGANGPDTTGADFHMIEFRYRYCEESS
ncbi:acyloxyacyl hydrolase [Halomonas caseinilytica]|uniref:acyloxyacyl hydrolase n=1 Tax=Halomonas caseinilytica TaxID=438744 RepID=UPI0009F22768